MSFLLSLFQIIVSILLISCILLQQRGTALGSAFGESEGGFYGTRRGIQKTIFYATVVLGALFIILGILNLMLS
ncbi:preprotein translocase subunit SecG [bacterium]|nr:preprotein translocase subunit SecG [bacterium]